MTKDTRKQPQEYNLNQGTSKAEEEEEEKGGGEGRRRIIWDVPEVCFKRWIICHLPLKRVVHTIMGKLEIRK